VGILGCAGDEVNAALRSLRCEAHLLAQFQSIMKDQEPYMELWQEARKRETAASAVAG